MYMQDIWQSPKISTAWENTLHSTPRNKLTSKRAGVVTIHIRLFCLRRKRTFPPLRIPKKIIIIYKAASSCKFIRPTPGVWSNPKTVVDPDPRRCREYSDVAWPRFFPAHLWSPTKENSEHHAFSLGRESVLPSASWPYARTWSVSSSPVWGDLRISCPP